VTNFLFGEITEEGCAMTHIRNVFLGLVSLATLLTGCVTVACDPDDPKFGKDCYECTRKATVEARKVDPEKGSRINTKDQIKDRTEECLRERGYIKQKQEDRPSLSPSMRY
jgi:hypothetical protein